MRTEQRSPLLAQNLIDLRPAALYGNRGICSILHAGQRIQHRTIPFQDVYKRQLYTMGDIARCSIGKPGDYHSEELLYRLFGVNAEILIDHAWGWEPCTIADVKAYKPENKSIVSGQVLQCPYDFKKARLVVREMADALALELVDKGLVTNQLVLTVGYRCV